MWTEPSLPPLTGDASGTVTAPMLITVIRAMLSMRDDVSAAQLGKVFLTRWAAAEQPAKVEFLTFAASALRPSSERLAAAVAAYEHERSPAHEMALFSAAVSERQRAFRLLNAERGGMATLIQMRETIQAHGATGTHRALLEVVDRELAYLLSLWLSAGSLTFQEINWNSPAAIVERIIKYESVHEVRDWTDLRRRLQPDRRCYGFFHPLLADEPIIFVEVALTIGLSDSIDAVLGSPPGPHDATSADTAVFYSISNCHDGLRGIPFGGLLLKRAIDVLSHEFPQIRRFGTLSPIPGFRNWLAREHPKRASALEDLDPDGLEAHRGWLVHQCAVYLTSTGSNGRPLDAVGRFHLGNGAQVTRINWLADSSANGWKQSFGIMVNYGYEPDQLEANVEALVNARVIAAVDRVRALAAGCGWSTADD